MSDAHGVARDQLRAFIGRIERLEEEKKTIAEDIKGVYGEAKSMGFDAKILRKVISSASRTPTSGPSKRQSSTPTCTPLA